MIRYLTAFCLFLTLCGAAIPPATAQTPIAQRIVDISLPEGKGPFPAVILMHWTGGPGDAEKKWARLLTRNGIAAVTLKSYSSLSGDLQTYEAGVPARIGHLKEANSFVRAQSWSNGRVSVLGRSHGAWAVMDAMQSGAVQGLHRAVAVAPVCTGQRGATTRYAAKTPVLIVIGSRDRSEYYKPCAEYATRLTGTQVQVASFKAGHSVDLDARDATAAILGFLK